ncbi:MAG: aminopeptidase P family protein [Clostridia bacterium]|nr:aminopeptidase P family protein [Clostridia bacterium]
MRENIKSLCNKISEKADAMLVTSPVNRRYVTGFNSSDGFVVIRDGKITFITDPRYYESACIKQRNGCIDEEIVIERQTPKVMLQLKQLLDDCKNVLFEDKNISYDRYLHFCEVFENVELVTGGSDIFSCCRAVKTPEELQKIKTAQSITDKAFGYIVNFIADNIGKDDFTEKALQLELDYYMMKNGADGLAFDTIVVSGSKSSLPHGVAEDVPVAKGFLTMDFGAKFSGYCSDMTRTVCIGKPDNDMKRVYDTTLEAQLAALDKVHGEMVSGEADKLARDVIDTAGYRGAFGHSLGHSLGLEIHESPNFSPNAQYTVPNGVVISVEPGIYLEGKYGVRIEDIVYLKDDGCENLTGSTKHLIVI